MKMNMTMKNRIIDIAGVRLQQIVMVPSSFVQRSIQTP